MKHSKTRPELNAGSMADIAFLLLIFFLVTAVIPNDQVFNRKLPRLCEDPPCSIDMYERNIINLVINGKDELMIKYVIVPIQDLKSIVKGFVDNNGDMSCLYCTGSGLKTLSDNPKKAIISLATHSKATYNFLLMYEMNYLRLITN